MSKAQALREVSDDNHCLVDKNWLWTAIARATGLNNVTFYKYENDVDDECNKRCMYNYLCRKVEGYKVHDRKAKMKIDHRNYIAADWSLEKLNRSCEKCDVDYVKPISSSIRTNLTAQRKFNDQSHTISSCIAYCKRCSCNASVKEKF